MGMNGKRALHRKREKKNLKKVQEPKNQAKRHCDMFELLDWHTILKSNSPRAQTRHSAFKPGLFSSFVAIQLVVSRYFFYIYY